MFVPDHTNIGAEFQVRGDESWGDLRSTPVFLGSGKMKKVAPQVGEAILAPDWSDLLICLLLNRLYLTLRPEPWAAT